MQQADMEQLVIRGAERWKTIKERQYQLVLPVGVYASDIPICVLLAEMPGTDDELVGRITAAAELLSRLRANPAIGGLLPMGSDATAVFALASIPEDTVIPAELPAPVPVPVAEVVAEPVVTVASEPVVAATDGVMPAAEASTPAVGCEHVGSDGKCTECTGDRAVECGYCEKTVVVARGHACKEYDDCEHIYCSDCAGDNINEHGYCDDCSTVTCEGCDETIDRGTQKTCARTFCESKPDYCDDCAGRLLNAEGLCSGKDCSGEVEVECSDCGLKFLASKLTNCKNGEDGVAAYCDKCKGDNINEQGYCDDCRTVECSYCDADIDRGTETTCKGDDCGQAFCEECAKRLLSEAGRCADCLGEENQDCSDCGNTFVSLRLTGCKNEDECENAYCPDCQGQNLDCGRCTDCRDEA